MNLTDTVLSRRGQTQRMISCEIPDLYKIQNRQSASGAMNRDGTRAPSWGAVTRRASWGSFLGAVGVFRFLIWGLITQLSQLSKFTRSLFTYMYVSVCYIKA